MVFDRTHNVLTLFLVLIRLIFFLARLQLCCKLYCCNLCVVLCICTSIIRARLYMYLCVSVCVCEFLFYLQSLSVCIAYAFFSIFLKGKQNFPTVSGKAQYKINRSTCSYSFFFFKKQQKRMTQSKSEDEN